MHHKGNVKPIVPNVTDVEVPATLACEISRDLALVQFNCSIMQVQEDLSSSSALQSNDRRAAHLTKENLVKEYPDRFEGLGAFKDMKPYHISLDSVPESAIHPPRQVHACTSHRRLQTRNRQHAKAWCHNAR